MLTLALGVGCTQDKTAQSNKDKVYYHDRKLGLGSNIPRSYSDANDSGVSQTSLGTLQTMPGQSNVVNQANGGTR